MHARVSQQTQEARISELQAEVDQLQHQLGQGEDAEKIVNQHIKLLHRYNEAKDATQILIGRLANLKEITVRQIHKDLELPIGD
ncbi:DNA repair protein [Lentinula raphanica]|uniref:DNA repair protein n=1 Tax=Lentinula raphanica TaxID=153919 RepID=A0AA38UM59_9AGAR|nr:DNA repair protein [Lentinula raphanica]KAJ3843782.1 DNA repair protein [Lentinula raphanica]